MKLFSANLALCLILTTGPAVKAESEYEAFRFGEITAKGWIYNQMVRDMDQGNLSCLDQLRNLGEPFSSKKGRGYGEFEGNYVDAVIRNAIVSGYAPFLSKAETLADRIVSAQDARGFMGGTRPATFKELHAREISLWSQACFLRGLLAYAEYSSNPKYLSAVIYDVDYIMSLFGDDTHNYFMGESSLEGGARAHGLMFVDVLETLHRLTGDKKYYDFAVRLYEDYSSGSNIKNRDNQRSLLTDESLPFLFHAPHIAEHSRVLYYLNEYSSDYDVLAANNLKKFLQALSPSGGLVTDPFLLECVGGKYGDPDLRYEYCSLAESAISFESCFRKTGDPKLGDLIENIVFNAAQAARFPDGKACAYCSRDNQYEAVGDDDHSTFRHQYAACHRIACCVFNQSRIMPYYVSSLWMKRKRDHALVAACYGPSQLATTIDGVEFRILEETMYPFENDIRFRLSPSSPVRIPLVFRIPSWCRSVSLKINGEEVPATCSQGFVTVDRRWRSGDVVDLRFETEARICTAYNNEYFFTYGALLYALPFRERLEVVKSFPNSELKNYNVLLANPADKELYDTLRLEKGLMQRYVSDKSLIRFKYAEAPDREYPYDRAYSYLVVDMVNGKSRQPQQLVPIGSARLRRTTFDH